MSPTDGFSRLRETQRLNSARVESDVPRIRLHDGTATLDLEGATLETQLEVAPGYIVFVTDDCPYEERLQILLLASDLQVLEALEVGEPYTPGIFRVLAMNERSVRFDFDGDPYTLRVHKTPRRLRTAGSAGIRRRSKWVDRKYLHVTRGNDV